MIYIQGVVISNSEFLVLYSLSGFYISKVISTGRYEDADHMSEDKQTSWVLGGNFELGVYPLPEIWLTAL